MEGAMQQVEVGLIMAQNLDVTAHYAYIALNSDVINASVALVPLP